VHVEDRVSSLAPDAFQQAFRIQNELLQVMLRGGAIATVAERLAELVANPVSVSDPMFHFIAGAPDAEHGDRHRRETMLRGGTAREVLDDPVAGAPFRRVAAEGRPVLFPPFPEHGMDERRLMAPILAGNELLGYVTIAEETVPIEEFHTVVIQQAALVLAVQLLQQRAVLEGELRLRSDFLRDLFNSTGTATSMRASMLGIDLFRPWDLLVIQPDDLQHWFFDGGHQTFLPAREALIEVARRATKRSAQGSVVVQHDDGIVVLRRTATNESTVSAGARHLADTLRDEARRNLPSFGTLSVAIGGRCTQPADFGTAYTRAVRALDVNRSLGRANQTLSLDDFGFYALLHNQNNPEELLQFADRTLGVLVAYDTRRKTSLLHTLDAYMDENGAFRRTAARLDVHLNTLRGRLERIREVCQVDLSNAKVRLGLQVALEIYRYARPEVFGPISPSTRNGN
jgi:sugar diacid utilization regulator